MPLLALGARLPPNAAEISLHRSESDPSGSPSVNRVPSTCRMTPGSMISVEQYTTQPIVCCAPIEAAITPPGSTLCRPVSPPESGSDWKYHHGIPFCAQIAAAPGASRLPRRGAISGRL